MFIDKTTNSISSAPAERNVCGNGARATYLSLRWSEKKSLAVARSINISLLMVAKANNILLTPDLNSRPTKLLAKLTGQNAADTPRNNQQLTHLSSLLLQILLSL
jgi:hypothetical protein